MNISEWASGNLYGLSYPDEVPELKTPGIGFFIEKNAKDLCEELRQEGLDVEVLHVPDDEGYESWYIVDREV